MERKKVICPVCWHRTTIFRGKFRCGSVRKPEDIHSMYFSPPLGGTMGQMVTKWDDGAWRCEMCQFSVTPSEAALMIDAVLRADCEGKEEKDPENVDHFKEAVLAYNGGKEK